MINKQVLSALLIAIMVLSIATSIAAATDDSGCSMDPTQEVRFTNDPLSNRIDNSLAEGKSVFLFFYADWCPYGHQETPIIDQLEGECAEEVTFIRINVTERPDHAAEFGVSALPTMVVISGTEEGGSVKEEISGFAKKAELSAIITPGEGDKLGDYASVMAPLATSTTCNSCEDCTEKLKSGEYDVVTLTTDITDHKGSCIGLIMGESNVVFDCGGHTIDGDDIAIDPEHGVTMMHGTGNTIKNCVISDFSNGIYLWDATDHEIIGNTVISNDEGIELGWSDSNTINGNTVNENYNGIILSNSNSNTINSNTVCKNTNSDFLIGSGTGNTGDENACETPDGWNDAGTTGCTNACSDRENIMDQAQEGTNYGYWFDNTVIRWQEFKPTQTSLSQIDLYIKKNGKPGDLSVSIKNDAEDQLWVTTVSGRDIVGSGWIEIAVDPSILFTPGDSYYIHVWSDSDSPYPDNRYFWRGQTDSKYDRGISCVEESLPGYDFAFRTWGSGGCVIPTDDLYINSDTTLCPGVYNIPDAGTPGVILINADGVVLDCTGVTINGKGSGRGIYNLGFKNVVVTNCEISNYQYGIFLSYYSNDNQLIGNTVTSCSGSGFYLQTSSGVKLTENTVVSNRQGINLYNSSNT